MKRATAASGAVLGAVLCACSPRPCLPRTADSGGLASLDTGLDGMRWLGASAERAQRAGAEPMQILTAESAAAGDRLEHLVRVADDGCVLLLARGSESVQDIDLFAYGEDGRVWGADEAPDSTPGLLVCPPHPHRLYVVARVAAGQGLVAVGAQPVQAKDASRVAGSLELGQGRTQDAHRFEAWPGLDEKLQARRRQLGSSWQDVRRVAVPVSPHVPTDLSATLEANHCLDVLVVPSVEVAHLDVAVVDGEGRIIGRAGAAGPDRALLVCSATATPITVEIRPHSGEGLAAVVLSRSMEEGSEQFAGRTLIHDVAPTLPVSEVRREHAAHLARAGYGPGKVVGRGDLSIGRRLSVTVPLSAGCHRLDVLGGYPIRGLETWLWTPTGKLVAHDRASATALLFGCGPRGNYRLDAEALSLPGPFVVEHRDEVGTPKLLESHPLAASRLLHVMTSRGVIGRAAQVGAARAFALSPVELQRMEYKVPVGRCVDFTLALDAGASGAEIRLIDAGSGDELVLARGHHVASARACALKRSNTLRVRAELRTQAGETEGLVATRLLSPRR